MAALNCTVALVPAREYVFVLTDANARTGKRGEGGGEKDIKALGVCARDKLNKNGKLLLGFAEDNKLALLNTFFCTPKSGVSYTFQSANRSKRHARLNYIPTKQADRLLIRCVNVRRPHLRGIRTGSQSRVRQSPHPTQVLTKPEDAALSFFWDFVRKLETRTREGNQAGFYKPLKTMNLKGKRDSSSANVKDENGVLLRNVELIRERWVR